MDDGDRAPARYYVLLGSDAVPYRSPTAGTVGGHRRQRIYGRLDCPAALRALRRGNYAAYRVFFADEATAVAAGYRPCARCLPEAYRRWKSARSDAALPPPDRRPGRTDVPVHQLQGGQQDQRESGGQVVLGQHAEHGQAAEDR
ncbi:hypothetical protein NOVA_32045 [Nocardia nova]|uniref:Ada DNA repair metal-binding domain-containing protein n=1 Tax=Nocardia nova TaxID=37330 RepID=A0A2S5ZWS7_9NOCA|nr:hypothetical protein [Nocardia nova]MBV7707423.1 hypothetical protein [Nocardia nova]PPJ02639.1 hypothetical protein C5E51_30130 [Nocardia nova]PPJ22115.1 hypothetical protein C5F51_32275 [Nocardia nova]